MVKVSDKNRDNIIKAYAHRLLDDMDWDALYAFAYERLIESKDLMDTILTY